MIYHKTCAHPLLKICCFQLLFFLRVFKKLNYNANPISNNIVSRPLAQMVMHFVMKKLFNHVSSVVFQSRRRHIFLFRSKIIRECILRSAAGYCHQLLRNMPPPLARKKQTKSFNFETPFTREMYRIKRTL